MYGAGDVRVEEVADPKLEQPTDALVRIVRACVCGSDLHPYHQMPASAQGVPMGHEFVGVVEAAGSEVSAVKAGDFVISPFAWSDNTCDFCREGFQTSCRHGGFYAANGIGGAQAEAIRVPLADGTLVKAPVAEDSALVPSLLTLSDVFLTGHHAVVRGGPGEEGIAKVLDLTGGDGTHVVVEAVGRRPAYDMAVGVVRVGGTISRVGVPQYEEAPVGFASLFGKNVTLTGGPAPVRAYIEELLPEVLDGRLEPGQVFDRTVSLEDVPAGYRLMDDRESIKVLVTS